MDNRDFNNMYKTQPFKVEGEFICYVDPDTENEIKLPVEYGVCSTCQGKGSHTNPSIDYNGLPDDCVNDPDFMEDYMGGTYDVPCSECNGLRVVPTSKNERFQKMLNSHYDFEASYAAECEAERRIGA